MAQFKNSVITEKGLALLQKVQQRTLKLTYTQIILLVQESIQVRRIFQEQQH